MDFNKRANIVAISIIFIIMFLVLFLGVIMAFGDVVLNWAMDEATPLLTNLGTVENVNLTKTADITIVPLNNLIQNFTWMTGVLYFLMIIGIFGIAISMRLEANKWLIGFFFMCMILLVLASIFISNIYEDFLNDPGSEIALRLTEHTILTFMIVNAPVIFTIIGFIVGIIIFSGIASEEFV